MAVVKVFATTAGEEVLLLMAITRQTPGFLSARRTSDDRRLFGIGDLVTLPKRRS